MKEIRFSLETATAMFCHGADPQFASLRAPAFKAAMRYWFRAVVGATDKAALLGVEGRIFGDTNRRGLVVRLDLPHGSKMNYTDKKSLLPHKGGSRFGAIPAGVRFELAISSPRRHDEEALLMRAAAAGWIAFHFGCVGQRSRRGAGSLVVHGVSFEGLDRPGWAAPLSFTDPLDQLAGAAGRQIRETCRAIVPDDPFDRADLPYSAFSRNTAIQLAPLAADGEEQARKQVMLDLRPTGGRRHDPVFGLPLVSQSIYGRRASPLWVKLARRPEGFVAVQTVLRASGSYPRGLTPDWSKIDAYLGKFRGRVKVI